VLANTGLRLIVVVVLFSAEALAVSAPPTPSCSSQEELHAATHLRCRRYSRRRIARTSLSTCLLLKDRQIRLVSERPGPASTRADGQALAVNNEGAPQYQTADGQQIAPPSQRPQSQQLPQGVSSGPYQQQPYPSRTASTHRLSAHLDQATQSYPQQQQQQLGPPQLSPATDQSRPDAYQPQSPPANLHEPKKSFRSRLAAGFSGHSKEDEAAKQAAKNNIGRRQSVRKSDPRLAEQQQQQQLQDAHRIPPTQQWQQQGSSPHLPTSTEQDEDNLDPFLQQDGHSQPQVPPKDFVQHPQGQQQFAANPQGQQYRPPLDRVSTEGSYRTQGGVSQYSPDHHSAKGLQPQQQQQQQQTAPQQQYQTYQPAVPPAQGSGEYQAFNPQNTPSPLSGNSQLHAQGPNTPAQHQQGYYQQTQEQKPQQNPAYSPQDHSQHNAHPLQQGFVAPQPQPQPHLSQEFQQHQPGRTSSQQPPELQHPQAIRQPPQIVQGQQLDPQQSQQLRPPSSHQLAPPSPLQPPSYKTYDAQSAQQPQAQLSESHSANSTPLSQAQDNMPPSTQNSGRNTLRKVNDGVQPPGPPTRESSLLQQPSGQGQPFGHPLVSPGIATFEANVVPTASQGQPYRGDKGQQAQQTQAGGELGQATPPPRSSATDMSDEEIEKMMKEHEVLREYIRKCADLGLTNCRRKVPKSEAVLL
jgi:hypothetical protein